jgi:hypothetical protein
MNEVIFPKRNAKIFSRETFSRQANKIITNLILILGGMIIVLSAVFISMSSATSQKGYELKLLQNQNEDLRVASEKLQTQLNESQSFDQIQNTKKLKEMASPDTRQYVTSKHETLK